MNIITETPIDLEVKEEDFFSEFGKPREFFETAEKEEITESLFDNVQTDEVKVLSSKTKKETADEVVGWATFGIAFVISIFTGVDEIGRYEPKQEQKEKLAEEVAKRLPDTMKLPGWMQIFMVVAMSYAPIIKIAKDDIKQRKEAQKETESEKLNIEIVKESTSNDGKPTD